MDFAPCQKLVDPGGAGQGCDGGFGTDCYGTGRL
jgi:hypothetical protein